MGTGGNENNLKYHHFSCLQDIVFYVFYVGVSAGSSCLVIGPEIFVSMGPWASVSQQGPPRNVLGWEPDTSAGVPRIKWKTCLQCKYVYV